VTNPNGVAPLRMNLSQENKDALIAFLKTLSDEQLVADVKFSDPFSAN
jgi:cytochrome c peroxidase